MKNKKIVLVVAHARNRVIGKDNKLLWKLPCDMEHFKSLTTGKSVIMGRKTWESLPEKFRPLPNRINFVASSRPGWHEANPQPHFVVKDLVAFLRGFKIIGTWDTDEIYVIGGSEIYQLALPYATEIIATQIHADFEGDSYFPAIEEKDWEIVSRVSNPEQNGLQSEIVTYRRV